MAENEPREVRKARLTKQAREARMAELRARVEALTRRADAVVAEAEAERIRAEEKKQQYEVAAEDLRRLMIDHFGEEGL